MVAAYMMLSTPEATKQSSRTRDTHWRVNEIADF
jgi:hypothetical protein